MCVCVCVYVGWEIRCREHLRGPSCGCFRWNHVEISVCVFVRKRRKSLDGSVWPSGVRPGEQFMYLCYMEIISYGV